MWSMQCNVEFGYQLRIFSRIEKNQGKLWSSWPVARPSGCKLTSSQQSGIKYAYPNIRPYLAVALFEKSLHICFYVFFMCVLWMSSKVFCITLAGWRGGEEAHTHTHSCKHTYIYICNCLSIDEFKSLLWGGKFFAHPITGFYYYSSYLISSSFHNIFQHKRLIDVAVGVLEVLKSFEYSGYL
jgi:hypothetical protein